MKNPSQRARTKEEEKEKKKNCQQRLLLARYSTSITTMSPTLP